MPHADPALAERPTFSGMPPALAREYERWHGYCCDTVLATVDRIATDDFLRDVLGRPLRDQEREALRTAWWAPYRSYQTRTGKGLRPFLVCLTAEALGTDPRSVPTLVAMAELIHSASLVLDDVADDSPLRRGGPTVHQMVGTFVAGRTGSVWLNACFELLARDDCGIERRWADLLADELSWEHWVTGLGTTVDCVWSDQGRSGRFAHRTEEYLQSVVHRSTSYTYRMPLRIGTAAAGAPPHVRSAFAAFGEEVGLAFQLTDDVLNLTADEKGWGKQLGEDVTQGKVTLQVLLALQLADAADADVLRGVLAERTDDPERLAQGLAVLHGSGALRRAEQLSATHLDRARQIVQGMDFLDERHRGLFTDVVDYLQVRRQ